MVTVVLLSATLWFSLSHLAIGQCSEYCSIVEIDPAVALNAFAVLSGAIVLLFKSCGSRP